MGSRRSPQARTSPSNHLAPDKRAWSDSGVRPCVASTHPIQLFPELPHEPRREHGGIDECLWHVLLRLSQQRTIELSTRSARDSGAAACRVRFGAILLRL